MAEPNIDPDDLSAGVDKPSNESHTFVVERFVVEYFEAEDILFHFGSSVMLPVPDDGARANDPARERTSGLSVMADVLEFAQNNSGKKVLVAGHTDTTSSAEFNLKLSEMRAKNVQLYLAGKRDAWAADCMAHKVADYQSILRFIAREHGVPCDPGSISGKLDDATIAALGNFRNGYNMDERFPVDLPLFGPIGPEDFGAFYDFYEITLARLLEMEPGDLAQERGALSFCDPPILGCGEAFNVEKLGDERRSAVNRRVEVLFFKSGQEPKTSTVPPGIDIYGGLLYERRPIKVRSPLHLSLIGADGKPASGAAYVLRWPDGQERRGSLDGDGKATLTDAPGGECTLQYPDSEWVVPRP
jgi:hypothetical protein